ncbi:MAG TPA: BON domain-containing protein [Gammaproteobacteria bacterium]|nr:BON domain-containing protein [Gammaproteobacteria bacterium]
MKFSGYTGLLIILLIPLYGCVNAAMTSVQAFYNRHSIQKSLSDQYITIQAYQALHTNDNRFKDVNISIATYNNEVLLAGQTPHLWQKLEVERTVKQIADVERVYDTITIANPSSTLTRISDTWITTKIKAKLLTSADVDATRIKVVTENGVVYLMGILPPDEAKTALSMASSTGGVAKVVNLFSYIKITKEQLFPQG